jgi:hypothetical protein
MKVLGAAMLMALCLSLAGAALAQDSWNPTADTLPPNLYWDEGRPVSVTAENNGSVTPPPPATWDSTYSIISVQGVTAAAVAVDRWGVTEIAVAGPVPPTDPDLAGMYTWDFTITAPPIATLTYGPDITPTSVATVTTLDCNWAFAKEGTLFRSLPTVANPIAITRFSDIAPGTPGGWAAFHVQECAGRVPMIVQGYGGGVYAPGVTVTRNQMAVFVQRAFQLPLSNYTGGFADLNPGDWADDEIQSCVDAGIVQGVPGDPLPSYLPTYPVDRGQMAVFVARGLAGGESGVPSGPPVQSFPDVDPDAWNYKHVEYAHAHDVVQGYPSGNYEPLFNVDRAQMAVFVYRAAIQPSGAVVALAGPAVTQALAEDCDGWSTAFIGEAAAPGTAYIGFDAVKAPSEDITVKFELRDAATPTTVATGDYTSTDTITAGELAAEKTEADTNGDPYVYATWEIPSGLEEGDYLLVVTVDGTEVNRQPAFTIGTPPAPPAPEEVVLHPTSLVTDNGTLTSGAVGDLAADDLSYVTWAAGATGLVGAHYRFGTTPARADVLKVKIALTYKASDTDVVPFNLMTSGLTGGTRYCATADTVPIAEHTFTWETANTEKIWDMLRTAFPFEVIFCSCDDTPGSTFDFSMDEVEVTFTLK